jgi:preprotein translocase subunit SecD
MKALVEYLNHKNIIFKSLQEIMPKELGSRKKVSLYLGLDLKGYYSLVMEVEKKSRVLRKEAAELMRLHEKLEQYVESKITKKYMIVKAPLCSHAKAMLEENGWKVWHEG